MKTALVLLAALSATPLEAEFAFLPPAACDDATDDRQCAVARPKEWSENDRREVGEAMRRLAASDLARGVMAGARANGYTGLRRYSTATKRDPQVGRVAMFSPGFVLYGTKTIGITDAFFQIDSVRDRLGDYRYADAVLLHELVHAFDDRQWSADARFKSLTGWDLRDDRWTYTHPVDVIRYRTVFAETLTLYARGQHGDARDRDRAFATAMAVPLPTIQSLVNPDECFADILTHLIIDPASVSYLPRGVIEWFEANVFPVLRAKARALETAS
jgi:hypothetical protein